jgi:flagellar biosynthetic protein FliR
MHFTSAEIGSLVGSFIWPLLRIGAFISVLPAFSMRGVPMQIRIVLVVALALAIVPFVPPVPLLDPISPEGFLVVFHQLIIGLTMGFALRLVFAALISAGQVVALGMGLGFASMVDPSNGVQVPVVSMFYNLMGLLLFFAFEGHLVTIQVMAESFHILPVAASGLNVESYWDLVIWASWIFVGAVLIALPAITAILVVNIGFGVMTRSAPQLNIFAVGFPVIMTIGFVLMLLTLPNLVPHFSALVDSALDLMRLMLEKGG